MKRIWVYILLFVAITPVLSAQAAPSSNATRLYIGAQLGDSVVGGLLGLQINKAFSVEVRYDYVDTEYKPHETIEASTIGVTGIGMYPVRFGKMAPFFIFMKAGYEQTTTETTVSNPALPGFPDPTPTVTTTERRRTVVGAGIHYDFSKDVSGRVGMNAVGSDHLVYITAIYKF